MTVKLLRYAGLCLIVAAAGCSKTPPVEEISRSANGNGSADQAGEEASVEPIDVAETDWPWWRGPNKNGIANSETAPLKWSETENVVWKTPVPGRGRSSPTVVGDRIFLTTADEGAETQSVVCFDRKTGEQLWQKTIHEGGFDENAHNENSQASGSVACDGKRLFVNFLNSEAVWATALDLEGNQLWQTKVGPFDSKWGYGASPALYEDSVIVVGDHQSGGYLAAVHRKTGEIIWRKERPVVPSYSSPIVGHVAGKDQIFLCGCNLVASYDPHTGDELWSVEGTAKSTCGTMVWNDEAAFASGGWPENETLAVRADGSGEVLWRNNQNIYVPSLLLADGALYGVHEGRGYCWDAETGERAWGTRLGNSKFRASPTLAGGHIYVPNVPGTMFVFKANPDKFELVAENQLEEEAYASPVITNGRLYLRVADLSGEGRQEYLYCIGKTAEKQASLSGARSTKR